MHIKVGDKVTANVFTEWTQKEPTIQTGIVIEVEDSVMYDGKAAKVLFPNGTELFLQPTEYAK